MAMDFNINENENVISINNNYVKFYEDDKCEKLLFDLKAKNFLMVKYDDLEILKMSFDIGVKSTNFINYMNENIDNHYIFFKLENVSCLYNNKSNINYKFIKSEDKYLKLTSVSLDDYEYELVFYLKYKEFIKDMAKFD